MFDLFSFDWRLFITVNLMLQYFLPESLSLAGWIRKCFKASWLPKLDFILEWVLAVFHEILFFRPKSDSGRFPFDPNFWWFPSDYTDTDLMPTEQFMLSAQNMLRQFGRGSS